MSVDLCCNDRTVTEHFLNVSYVHIFFKKQRSKGMTKHMRRYVHTDPAKPAVSVQHISDRLLGHALSKSVDKEKLTNAKPFGVD